MSVAPPQLCLPAPGLSDDFQLLLRAAHPPTSDDTGVLDLQYHSCGSALNLPRPLST